MWEIINASRSYHLQSASKLTNIGSSLFNSYRRQTDDSDSETHGARDFVSSLRQLHADSVSVCYMTVSRGGLLVVRVFTMTSVYWSIIKLHSISSACVYSDTRHSCSEWMHAMRLSLCVSCSISSVRLYALRISTTDVVDLVAGRKGVFRIVHGGGTEGPKTEAGRGMGSWERMWALPAEPRPPKGFPPFSALRVWPLLTL